MKSTNKKKTQKNKGCNTICYLLGSTTLYAVAIMTIPKIMPYISGTIYKNFVKSSNAKKIDDDWGPVIEKKK
ncbi:hypothetical protein [Acetoanaerobium noterae]|uniref:hypothetical protein n=1 Tax=Acetoanaerobium noterae TaxID=745369 RepID=UPI0028A7003C|nr:hypothetical protein [Acetoanaerobium noterae]